MRRLLFLLCIAVQASGQNIVFPLKASTDKHYIVDANNQPVFLAGCAAWRLGYNVAYNDAKKFLADRKAKGFNALIVEITPDNGTNNRGDVADINGNHCFINRDVSKPNEKFFAHADSILQLCNDMHFAVMLFPLYLGCCNDGWIEYLQQAPNTVQKCRDYGKWVANRYKHLNNIIWASGGDHNETPESIAFAEGIASIDTVHLHTYHPNPAKNYITVNLPLSANKATLQLLDANGRVVKNINNINYTPRITINIKGLANGAYKLVWTNGANKQSATVLIE